MPMADPIVYGFQRSTYVNIVRLVLTHKEVPFRFHDLESVMGTPEHLALHPFDRAPILEHDGFRVYETSAIITYVDEAFGGPQLQPTEVRDRARMMQWISAVGSYYYYWFVYHLGHERIVFPELGIEPDEKIVAVALPNAAHVLDVLEGELGNRNSFLVGAALSLADFAMLPMLTSLSQHKDGQDLLATRPRIKQWRERMEELPSVKRFRASLPPREPIWHARKWAESHRPKY
jgi:glutathione S-transferase